MKSLFKRLQESQEKNRILTSKVESFESDNEDLESKVRDYDDDIENYKYQIKELEELDWLSDIINDNINLSLFNPNKNLADRQKLIDAIENLQI
tara:strand:- start:46 stop:327 length:282 start_codon:yes stop_codon:yes gene_type:complete